MNWHRIISFLDYHEGKWYVFRDGGWLKCTHQSVVAEFQRCGYDSDKLVRQFRDRDKQATARRYKR